MAVSNAPSSQASFPETHWSLVAAAASDATELSAEAVESLCQAYWYPLYAFARRSGQPPHDAQDLTQQFFHRLLEKQWLAAADREKGRLRTFLITAMKRLMANEHRSIHAARRGGGMKRVLLDTDAAEGRYKENHSESLSAGDLFDREWALNLLDRTMDRLGFEFARVGKERDFDILRGCLTLDQEGIDYTGIADRLGSNPGAARVAIHRLRRRFRAVYRDVIAQTLPADADLEAEMQHLSRILCRTENEESV